MALYDSDGLSLIAHIRNNDFDRFRNLLAIYHREGFRDEINEAATFLTTSGLPRETVAEGINIFNEVLGPEYEFQRRMEVPGIGIALISYTINDNSISNQASSPAGRADQPMRDR